MYIHINLYMYTNLSMLYESVVPFLLLSSFPLYEYAIIYPFLDGHLVGFQFGNSH